MNTKQNLHTHSTHCDGLHTPEEVIRSAIEKGYGSLGFSGHSYAFFSNYAGITMERQEAYVQEILRLKQEYADRLKIYLGLEVEMHCNQKLTGFDYLIGSFHYFKLGDKYVGFDGNAQKMRTVVEQHFGGDAMAYVREYFRQLAQLPQHGKFDFIAHFDLVSKNIEQDRLFDYDGDEYLRYATEAAEALLPHIPYFEVNTGAMARGVRTTPYPSPRITRMLKDLGFRAVITTDCHDANKLEYGLAEARQLLEASGFREHHIWTDDGFIPVKL